MILADFKDFPKTGRIIGIDWGARRTGVAITYESREFVFSRPLITPMGDRTILKQIVDLINTEKVSGIIIGLPLRMNGTESDTTKNVRDFANSVAEKIDIPICFLDETLTSVSAQESMGRVRVHDIKQQLDSESARVILENAIAIINRL
jgi:putative Holliday junction resolvase